MSGNPSNNRSRNNNENENYGWSWAATAGLGAAAAAAALVGGLYYLRSRTEEPQSSTGSVRSPRKSPGTNTESENRKSSVKMTTLDNLSDSFVRLTTSMDNVVQHESRRGVPLSSIPEKRDIKNLNVLLDDIYSRYIALRDDDFEMYYGVFTDVFRSIHNKMKEIDPYFGRYASIVQLAGSHYDRVRIGKPDEFDVDIVIDLPLNIREHLSNPLESDICIEPKEAGFVQLRTGTQYKRLPMRDGQDWQINKAAYSWADERGYLLRSKFMDWFIGVLDKALNSFSNGSLPVFYSKNVPYTVRKSLCGPARTIYIENASKGFKLDVDLVPALRFPEDRWPITPKYRSIPTEYSTAEKVWMVVPKPNKNGQTLHDELRSWRLALHVQERKMMHDSQHLRQVIRLLKKLRDAQEMNKIASYYIKTLVLWEIEERRNEPGFWSCNNPAKLFKILVKRFHDAVEKGNIPYFWNKNCNLINKVDRGILKAYASKLKQLLDVLEVDSMYKHVARFLLTPAEFREYNAKFLNI